MRTRLYLVILLAFASLAASAHTRVEHEDYYEVKHSWDYNNKKCSLSLTIGKKLYGYYRNNRDHEVCVYPSLSQENSNNYFSFILSEYDRPVVRAVAEQFRKNTSSELEFVRLALAFVQSLPYAYDSDSKHIDEYMRFPVETLVDGCGDCEDKAALLAALLYEMDVDFILLEVPEHVALGVNCEGVDSGDYLMFRGKKYYCMETTSPNWQVGQVPDDYSTEEVTPYAINETPILHIKRYSFEVKPFYENEKAPLIVQVELKNDGPGKATGLQLHVRVVDKGTSNQLLADEYFAFSDMKEGEKRTEKVSFESLIMDNSVLMLELTGNEVESQYCEEELKRKTN